MDILSLFDSNFPVWPEDTSRMKKKALPLWCWSSCFGIAHVDPLVFYFPSCPISLTWEIIPRDPTPFQRTWAQGDHLRPSILHCCWTHRIPETPLKIRSQKWSRCKPQDKPPTKLPWKRQSRSKWAPPAPLHLPPPRLLWMHRGTGLTQSANPHLILNKRKGKKRIKGETNREGDRKRDWDQ